jgi:5-methylcytosine-specific restriction endonuclease McrA
MKNPRITAKERGLIKGALRRVFSRSDLRKAVLEEIQVSYTDPERPRVKRWSICALCDEYTPTYKIQVDHINPIIPLDKTLEDITFDQLTNNIWCDINNLQGICKTCHDKKTSSERKIRTANKKEKKANE